MTPELVCVSCGARSRVEASHWSTVGTWHATGELIRLPPRCPGCIAEIVDGAWSRANQAEEAQHERHVPRV